MRKAILLGLATFLGTLPAFAQDGGTGNPAYFAIAAGMAIGLAALGGGIGQGKIGSAAMDGIARNPQAQKSMFVPMIIGLALVESLVIYALIIAFMLVQKIG